MLALKFSPEVCSHWIIVGPIRIFSGEKIDDGASALAHFLASSLPLYPLSSLDTRRKLPRHLPNCPYQLVQDPAGLFVAAVEELILAFFKPFDLALDVGSVHAATSSSDFAVRYRTRSLRYRFRALM